jgi:hypothetical protein
MMNDHPQFDGIDYEFEHDEQGKLISCTSIIIARIVRIQPASPNTSQNAAAILSRGRWKGECSGTRPRSKALAWRLDSQESPTRTKPLQRQGWNAT